MLELTHLAEVLDGDAAPGRVSAREADLSFPRALGRERRGEHEAPLRKGRDGHLAATGREDEGELVVVDGRGDERVSAGQTAVRAVRLPDLREGRESAPGLVSGQGEGTHELLVGG